MKMQLNRYIALCGIASRRKAGDIIRERRISVNGEVIGEQGHTVETETDIVCLDGRRLEPPGRKRYILLNKPEGVITSVGDTHGRKTVVGLVGAGRRVFPVGRLDLDTSGVLLLTDDGDLAYRLTHPRYGIEKVYRARVAGNVKPHALRLLGRGVTVNGGGRMSGEVRVIRRESGSTLVEIVLHEGKKRQIKRMMKAAGHPVMELSRVRFAGLAADGLAPGKWRDLTEAEVKRLYGMTRLDKGAKRAG